MATRRGNAWLTVLCGALLLGCMVGQSASNFGPALGPEGVSAELRLGKVGPILEVRGELLAVPDTGLFVLTHQPVPGHVAARTVLFAPWASINRGEFHQVNVRIRDGRELSAPDRAKLARLSRFPQGLSPELLSDLLAAYELQGVFVPDSVRVEVTEGP